MPRKGPVPKRDVLPDPIYNSRLFTKLVNQVMWDGKKSLAENICYGAFEIVEKRTGKDAMEAFEEAMKNITPVVEVRARRVGGANYQVPVEVRPDRRQTLAIRWLIGYARKRGEKTMAERLAGEIVDACNGASGSVKKKEETHKMAEANKAFAHYRW
jgi:small subunit ribosomal protein S7